MMFPDLFPIVYMEIVIKNQTDNKKAALNSEIPEMLIINIKLPRVFCNNLEVLSFYMLRLGYCNSYWSGLAAYNLVC